MTSLSLASEGETWVVPMLNGNPDKNLGTTFRKLVKRSNFSPGASVRTLRSSLAQETTPKGQTGRLGEGEATVS